MRPTPFDPGSMAGNASTGNGGGSGLANALAHGSAHLTDWIPRIERETSGSLRMALRWGAHHTGLPVILVAAIALVMSWRILRRSLRLTVEVVLALALLVAMTRLGWLTW
jgi:hypothetical protein